ncbi:MAG: carboxypeptidase-like regulatory domain-containing protein, partial [Bacteroidota bacterium]
MRIYTSTTFIVVLLLLMANMAQAQDATNKKIKFSYVNKPLHLVLLDLKINERLNFQYEKSELEGIRISKSVTRMPLSEAMKELLAGTGLTFEIKPPNQIKVFKADIQEQTKVEVSVHQPQAFDITVSGIVKDAQTGETLPFANVSIFGTVSGSETNVDGYFTLFNVPTDTTILKVSYIGYSSQFFRLEPDMNFENLLIKLSPGGEFLQEVVVEANRQEQLIKVSSGVSKIAVAPAQLTSLPSIGEKDIFRSLQLLPGVSGSNESSSGLFVRGGTPDQNLVLFDGFTVYHVDHLFGFFSAFNSNAIKDVQLYKGGFEAKYGGRLSSVVDITGKDGNSEQVNTGVGISPLSVNGFFEAPFAGGKGTVLLTGRRSFQSSFYNNLLEFSDGDADTGTNEGETETQQTPFARRGQANTEPNSWFYDLNGKATFRLEKDIFSLSFYGGKDNLDNSRFTDQNSFGGGFG